MIVRPSAEVAQGGTIGQTVGPERTPNTVAAARQQALNKSRAGANAAALEDALQQRFDRSDTMIETLRNQGFENIADNMRRTNRAQAFNAARRGQIGSSMDLQQQAAIQEGAGQQAQQLEAQLQGRALSDRAKLQTSRDNLLKQVLSSDPAQLQQNAALIQQLQGEGRTAAEIGRAEAGIQQARDAGKAAFGDVIGGALSGAGTGLMAGMMA